MTTELAHATLTRLKQVPAKGKNGKPTYEPEAQGTYEVQFNPTSLKISRSNNIDKGGATTNTQKRQMPSAQPATLAFDLEFDTAEGDDNGQARDVRELTLMVRQFTEPTRDKPKNPPPAVRFQWGSFAFSGIVTQLTEDLDYFSPEGRPLRAKLSVTITEQNPDWEANALGPGTRDAKAAARPGGATRPTSAGGPATPGGVPGTGPGSEPAPNPVSTALARAGESVQQLLSRLDLDPATWRAAMGGLQSPLALQAGAQVQLDASASVSAGIGVGGGFTASAGVDDLASTRAALGVSGTAALGLGASAEASAGFVLAESGGVARATARLQADAAASAQAGARAAFAVPEVGASAGVQAAADVRVDPRSLGYGRGVPLRARVSGDAAATRRR